MEADELKKVSAADWQEKVHPTNLPATYVAELLEVERLLKEIDDILVDAGMEGLNYKSQETEIQELGSGVANLNAYIGAFVPELEDKIDQPLYEGFQNGALEYLSLLKLEDYSTENTLHVKRHSEVADERGITQRDYEAPILTMADFLGVTSLKGGERDGKLVGIPEELENFIGLFAADYDKIKGQLKDSDGKAVTLEDYLNALQTYGEFDNHLDKPGLEFLSGLLDFTLIKPLAEMCMGYDLITGDNLNDLDRGMKGVFAVVDLVTLLMGFKGSSIAKLFSKEGAKIAGKTVLVDLISNGVAYGVGAAGEELGLPLPVTLLLSMGAGGSVSVVAGKYVFRDTAGKVVLEASQEQVDALRRVKGASGANKGVGNPVKVEGRGSTGRVAPNNLNEQMAMHEVQSNPLQGASEVPITMSDPRWPASEGWVKMQKIITTSDGSKTTIHFDYNKLTGAFDDFKYK